MAKLWEGRTDGVCDRLAEDFNSSIGFDRRMIRQDIRGSIAHAQMLSRCGIIGEEDARAITEGLGQIMAELDAGTLTVSTDAEDVHTFVEQVLTARIGDAGKKLHTARSRNDQVALDERLYLRDEIDVLREKLAALISAIADKAEENRDTILPGYTHLQRAQPVTFGHHLLAYAQMFLRDRDRLSDCRRRLNVSPIGCCALAGTTYPTDRKWEAEALGFDGICQNSMDGVSDRDYIVELLSCLSLLMAHLSRMSEELILWSSWEFRFVTLSDAYTTGSSIMPQKKNPDMAELIRGKCGRVYGDLFGMLTVLKGLPLAYNKDMQEDKEGAFDACDTAKNCLDVMRGMIATLSVHPDTMRRAAQNGFINATDLADYLVRKGLPFRAAYKLSGQIVNDCIEKGKVLETLSLDEYRCYSPLFSDDVYEAVDLDRCVEKRISAGGTGRASVEGQLASVREQVKNDG